MDIRRNRSFRWLGGLMLFCFLFTLPHLFYYWLDDQYTVPRQMEYSEYHPLVREALETTVKKASPDVYRYVLENKIPIVFEFLPPDREAQRVVRICSSHIEISHDFIREDVDWSGARHEGRVVKVARCVIHEGTHCRRLDASNVFAMIAQEHRYAWGILQEEAAAYDAESALGFGVVHVRELDVADERIALLTGLLSRNSIGFLLVALVCVLARIRVKAKLPVGVPEAIPQTIR